MAHWTRQNPVTTQRSRQLRREMTDAERALWKGLRQRHLRSQKFRRQHPLGAYIVDFVCLDAKLIVEVDGGQHRQQASYDADRTRWLEGEGFRVLRFWNDEVLCQTEAVLEAIWQALPRDG